MSEIIVFDGYKVPKVLQSSKRSHTLSKKNVSKFTATSKKCNKIKGKANRKTCWRQSYGKK